MTGWQSLIAATTGNWTMGIYDDLTEAELKALYDKTRTAYLDTLTGDGIGAIAGEGRRLEYTTADSTALLRQLHAMLARLAELTGNAAYMSGNALTVEIL